MEGCKERARDAGLTFEHETLEYIVTNRDLLELSPKSMIPTLYDYWVHEVEVLKEKGKYELYPHNPYETVINTRPAISFYNDNNPDWLNVMIFYHVLAHIDFFQNNIFFRHTWDYDFTGQALSDKRMIAKLRSEKGRWVDYVIEFARGIDNLVGFHDEFSRMDAPVSSTRKKRLDFYFDVFLQSVKKVKVTEYIKEIERYNECLRTYGDLGEQMFFSEVAKKHTELETLFQRSLEQKDGRRLDLLQFINAHSDFLNKSDNKWMKSILEMVRKTSVFFQPQIRTKIMNEGWASFWHEQLFLKDDRIRGHEVDFARVNAWVTALPRVGLNPYALGMRLFSYIEEMADKGRYSYDYQKLKDAHQRDSFDTASARGRAYIFDIRKNSCDFTFINSFVEQDFVTKNRLFVAGKRLNQDRMVWEYYVRSRKAEDYREMLLEALYHPPHIAIDIKRARDNAIYLTHHFEGKPLVREYIANTLMGIEYLWGGPVMLETSEAVSTAPESAQRIPMGFAAQIREETGDGEITWNRVRYTMENRKLSREVIS